MALNYTDFNATRDFVRYTAHGRWFDAIFGTYHELVGGWFVLLFFAFTFFLLYIKTRSLGLCSIVMIVLASGMALILPAEFMSMMFVIIVLAVGALIASMFVSRR